MYQNIVIRGIGIYHPNNEYDNEYFIEHFKKMDIDAAGLMNHLGRKKRYLVGDSGETSLSMGLNAAKNALKSAHMEADQLDMIVFVSETPEYLLPTNALGLNNKLGAINAHAVYDMNCNCIGVMTALDNISRYMKGSKDIKRALIVGSLLISSIVRKDCPISYGNISDGSSAIILEKVEEGHERGFIDSVYYTNSMNFEMMQAPNCGFSNISNPDIPLNEKKLKWIPHDVSFFSDEWTKLIKRLVDRNSLDPSSIDHYLFSQFSKPDTLDTLKKLGLGPEKQTFVGEQYGYMGCSSPIFALYEALKSNSISTGSKVVFCSVGAGFTMCAILYVF